MRDDTFRRKILRLLRQRELISQERIDLLLSWRNSGFSVHDRTTVYPDDAEGLATLSVLPSTFRD
ncbi:MAG TPA: hypothetical protein VLK65_01750 [Vicinamibacteria bacterium]|nr:hypothetical protein [Vicinamibacteria bacterium]